MEMSITVTGQSLVDLASKLTTLGQSLTSLGGIPTEEKPKRGKKTKPKEEPEEELEETVEDETSVEDLEDEEPEEEVEEDLEEEEEEAEEEVEEDEEKKIDAKQLAQLKKALNSYSAKHGKPKAVKILHKYAKVSQDVKAEDYSKLMKALKV